MRKFLFFPINYQEAGIGFSDRKGVTAQQKKPDSFYEKPFENEKIIK
jgi:hypothetical protein